MQIQKKQYIISLFRYGDLSPITPIGRALASLCAIFGISVVSMLVSVLAERYQRVYTRKLFLNEQYSDNLVFEEDEINDPSLQSQTSIQEQNESIEIIDENHSIFKTISKDEEIKMSENSTEKMRFVIGFQADDSTKNQETIMTEIIKEFFQTKFGKQCVITRTDVV
jgi:hypothetical protein